MDWIILIEPGKLAASLVLFVGGGGVLIYCFFRKVG